MRRFAGLALAVALTETLGTARTPPPSVCPAPEAQLLGDLRCAGEEQSVVRSDRVDADDLLLRGRMRLTAIPRLGIQRPQAIRRLLGGDGCQQGCKNDTFRGNCIPLRSQGSM
jgi:hypothetical protein